MRVLHDRGRRFVRVALVPVLREKCETDVGIRQRVTPDDAADADWGTGLFQPDTVKTKPVLLVTPGWPRDDVLARVFNRAYAFIADVLQERRFVKKSQNE